MKKETGGSILQVGGCHAVDGLRWFVNDEAVEVVALSSKFRDDFEQDTTITFIAKFKSGSIGASLLLLRRGQSLHLQSRGVRQQGHGDQQPGVGEGDFPGQEGWITIPTARPRNSGDVSHHPFPNEVDHFVECIQAKKKTIVDLDDAIKTFEIIEAADRSATSGGTPVKLPLGW